jgi:hypothetical protein
VHTQPSHRGEPATGADTFNGYAPGELLYIGC